MLVSWVPLLLATAGLLLTFTVGLWNIGIEGQITLGRSSRRGRCASCSRAAAIPRLIITLAFLAGMAGGALWAMLAGALKTFGGVNEIFGGLGLNFVAAALNLWLIFGPWKRPGRRLHVGHGALPARLWLPTLTAQSRLAPAALLIAIVAILIVYFLIQGTHFGLRLKAVGRNANAAYLLGVPPGST